MSEKFDIYSKIFYRDVEKFVWYLCVLVLRHQMRVSNYFVNSFYSVEIETILAGVSPAQRFANVNNKFWSPSAIIVCLTVSALFLISYL